VGGGPSLPTRGRRALADGIARLRDALGATQVLLLTHDHAGGDLRRALPDDAGRARIPAGSAAHSAILMGGELDPGVLGAGAWSFPLRADGEGLGALVVQLGGSPPDARARLVATVAATVLALWQRNAGLFAGLRERTVALDHQLLQMRALTEIARAAGAGAGAVEIAAVVASEARKLARADGAAIVLDDPAGSPIVLAQTGAAPDGGWVAGAVVPSPMRVSVPVVGPDDRRGGVLVAHRRVGAPFEDGDGDRLDGLAQQAGVALARARLVEDLGREQEDRRRLALALIEAQERERARLGRDIHDGPIQELVGLGLLLEAATSDAEDAGWVAAADLRRAAAAARHVVAELRATIVDLHPLALTDLGFAGATRSLAGRLVERGVHVEVEVGAAAALAPEHQAVAVRILQEALANVTRHADATRVSVEARARDDCVDVIVTDDGNGFEPSALADGVARGHMGLAGMRERAALAGGEASVSSRPGAGTRVRVTLPLAPGAAPPGA